MPTPDGITDIAWQRAAERNAALPAAEKRAGGIVPTPPAIARFVAARLVDAVGPSATFVDPAVGTGIFPAALIEAGATGPIVGIDVDASVLGVVRALLGDRVILHSANALAATELDPHLHEAAKGPIAVLGNPPWAGKSRSRGLSASDALVSDFDRDEHGARLGERKRGVLSDDYVRFVRWALLVAARRRDGGAIGLVTNASFIDGPVHRGMRRMLVEAFSDLEIIDLGGSALVARQEGVRDENLFGVRPAAAVILGKTAGVQRVAVARLFGSSKEKLAALSDVPTTNVTPEAPDYAFRPRAAAPAWYRAAPSLAEWLPFHREGVQTNRDALVIDADLDRLRRRIDAVAAGEVPLDGRAHFDPLRARERLGRELALAAPFVRIAYRPFDDRWLYAGPSLCHRARPDLMRAVERSELVLVSARKDRGELPFRHLALTRLVPDNCLLSPRSSCRARGFPTHDPEGAPNLGPDVRAALEDRIGRPAAMDEVLFFLAAHLGAPAWTAPLDGALKADYPRVPLPRGSDHYAAMVAGGRALFEAFAARRAGGVPAAVTVGHHRLSGPFAAGLAQAQRGLDALHAPNPLPAVLV